MCDLKRLCICLFLLVFCVVAAPAHAAKSGNEKYASLVLDAQTGKVISSRYADKTVHPASLTKMMTLYMVFRELEAGRLTLNSRVPVSKHAAGQPPSKAGVAAGKSVRVEDIIGLLVTRSANDMAAAIGEKISGTESRFGEDMTKVARAMGMNKTRFTNASGLPDPRQVTSARDMAILARALIYHYPQYYHYFSIQNYSFNGQNYHSHNRMMKTFEGMDGLKTGFINSSGFNLVASAKRDGRRLIGVVFGGRSWQTRNDHMGELLNAGFEKVKGERPIIQEVAYEASQKPMVMNAVATTTPAVTVNTNPTPVVAATVAIAPMAASPVGWSIQIGAFSSQSQTQAIASQTAGQLKGRYRGAAPLVVPFQSEKGTIYRARITGFTQSEAVEACRSITSCLVVQPNG